MTIFSKSDVRRSRLRLLAVQTFALEHLVCIHGATIDMRWAMVELALRSFTAMCALAQVQLVRLAGRIVRPGKKGCPHRVTAADTMVAAGGR